MQNGPKVLIALAVILLLFLTLQAFSSGGLNFYSTEQTVVEKAVSPAALPPTLPPTPPPTLPPTHPPTPAPTKSLSKSFCGSNGLTCAIATGASGSHYESSIVLLYTIAKQARFTKIYFYDLGLNDNQREVIKSLQKYLPFLVVKIFPYQDYPSYMHMDQPFRGAYAWKPIIVEEVLREHDLVAWMDAGDRLLKPLHPNFWDMLAKEDFYGSTADHNLGKWAFHKMVSYFNVDKDDIILRTKDCSAAFLGFSKKYYDILVIPWKQCALDINCIRPEGSDFSNHRFDQSAIGILAMRLGKRCIDLWNKDDLFAIQRDGDRVELGRFEEVLQQ